MKSIHSTMLCDCFIYKYFIRLPLKTLYNIILISLHNNQHMNNQKPFPIKQFHSYMMQTSSMKSKMAPILSQFQKNNISWMLTAVSELQRILKTPKQNIVYKFSSLFVVKIFLDSCEIPLTNMLEAFIWDYVYQIATYNCSSDSKPAVKYAKYFTQKQGYESNIKNIDTYSFNFVTIAVQLIFAGAAIKPKKLVESIQLQQTQSKFSECLNKLKNLKLLPPSQFGFYKSGFKALRQKFLNKLNNYDINASNNYSALFLNLTNITIENGLDKPLIASILKQEGQKLLQLSDIKKIMASGDLFVTNDVITFCLKQLGKSQKLHRKINSLQMLNNFIKWGDMDAYLMLLKSKTMDQIAKKIGTDSKLSTAPKTLERKKYVYPEITDRKQREKIELFYEEYLRKIQLWADIPTAQQHFMKTTNQKNIKFKQIYNFLAQKCGLTFPQNSIKQSFKKQADENFKKNAERNIILLNQQQQLQQEEKKQSESKISFQGKKSSKVPENKKQMFQQIKQERTPGYTPDGQTPGNQMKLEVSMKMNYKVFKKALKTANQHIQYITAPTNNFSDKQALKIDDYLSSLISFQQNFQTYIQNFEEGSASKVDEILEEGIVVCDKIQAIQKIYARYKSNQIDFEQFKRTVSNNHKKSQKQIIRSQMKQSKKQTKGNVYQSSVNTSNDNLSSGIKHDHRQFNSNPSQTSMNPSSKLQSHLQQNVQHQPDKKTQNLDSKNMSKHNMGSSKNIKGQKFSEMSDSINDLKLANESKKQFRQTKERDLKKNNQKIIEQSIDNSISNIYDQRTSRKQLRQTPIHNSHESKKQRNLYDNGKYQQKDPHLYNKKIEVKQYDQFNNQVKIEHQVLDFRNKKNSYKLIENNEYNSRLAQRHRSNLYENSGNQRYQRYHNDNKNKIDQIISKSQQSQISFNFIEQPELTPLEQSYHNPTEIRQQIQNSKNPSFKSCFTMDNYLLSLKNNDKLQSGKKQKIFWLENQVQNLMNITMKPVPSQNGNNTSRPQYKNNQTSRIVDQKTSRINSANKSVFSVPQLLEQRNRKFKQQIEYVEKTKQQEVQKLKKKIKDLENKGKYMENELTKRQREIQSLRSNSQFGDDGTKSKYDYINDQNTLFKNKMQSNGARTPNKRFNRDMGKSFVSDRPKTQYHSYNSAFSQSKLIVSEPYQQFYIQHKKEKQKKYFLKHKQLVLKDELIEIGCLVHRIEEQKQDNFRLSDYQAQNYLKCGKIKIIFYITPTLQLGDFHYIISQQTDLKIYSNPKSFSRISSNKQQKIQLEISVINLPYYIPSIEFIYQINFKQYRKKIPIPCSFHKFLHIEEMKDENVRRQISQSLRLNNLKRSEQIPYSRKILKDLKDLTIIQDYLPGIKLIDGGFLNEKGQIEYAGLCHFGQYKFLLKINIKPNQFLYIQAVNFTPQKARNRKVEGRRKIMLNKDELLIDFSMSLLSHLFMKDVNWV